MQSVEPVLENAIKTLQKVVDVRGMGKKSLMQLMDNVDDHIDDKEAFKQERLRVAKETNEKNLTPMSFFDKQYKEEYRVIDKQQQNEDFVNRLALENFVFTKGEPPIQGIAENEEQRKEALDKAVENHNSEDKAMKDQIYQEGHQVIGKQTKDEDYSNRLANDNMLLLSEEPAKAEEKKAEEPKKEEKKEAAKAEEKEETPKDDKEAAAKAEKDAKKEADKEGAAEKKKKDKEDKAIKEMEADEAAEREEHHENARKRTAQEAITHWAEEGKKWIDKQTKDEAQAFKDYNDRSNEKFHAGRPYNSALTGLESQTGTAIQLNAGLTIKNQTFSSDPVVMSRIDSAKKLLALAQAAENEDN
jgi:hypothetical protein